jgi:hypothetical protein
MQLHFTDILHKPMYVSVCRTIPVSVQPVWLIVLHVKIRLHVPLQCRTDTLALPQLIVCLQQPYFVLVCQAGHRKCVFPILGTLNNTLIFYDTFHIHFLIS